MKIRDIARFLRGELTGDGDVEISGIADVARAATGQIAFTTDAEAVVVSGASCLLVPNSFSGVSDVPYIRTANPKFDFAAIAQILHPPKILDAEIHESAVIAVSAKIGSDVFIGAYTYIGNNSEIGNNTDLLAGARVGDNVKIGVGCVLHPNVVIEEGCMIGDRVTLHAGVVIGADGFGYVRGDDRHVKFPQIGTVVIENDVEIGANTCIDRGSLSETRIGEGTKIDNLVQIAHNVQIGKRVIIAAQTGISGSTVIEDDCVIGGQVGIGDHARILSGAIIGSQAGVLPGKIVRAGVWWGTPVQPLNEYKRQNAMVKGLDRLRSEVKRLNKIIAGLVSENKGK